MGLNLLESDAVIPSGRKKFFIVRLSEKRAKEYSKTRVLQKLVLGELSPSHEVMGDDGLWKPLEETPGFRRFCANLKGDSPTKPTNENSDKSLLDIGKIIEKIGNSPKDSVWDGFQLDEEDGTQGDLANRTNRGSSGEIPILPFPPSTPADHEITRNNHGNLAQAPPGKPQPVIESVRPVDFGSSQNDPGDLPIEKIEASRTHPGTGNEKLNQETYGMLADRESQVARRLRKKMVASFAPKPQKSHKIWFERVVRSAFLLFFLCVAYKGTPVVLDQAHKFWVKMSSTTPEETESKKMKNPEQEIRQRRPPPGTPAISK
jgi:hypothetical protein